LWVVIAITLLILFPLIAVDIHHRLERRNHRARGQRKTDKIKL
jgi:hypothetical protein